MLKIYYTFISYPSRSHRNFPSSLPAAPPMPCPRDYNTIIPTHIRHVDYERKSDPPFATSLERSQPFKFGRSRTGMPCSKCLKSKPVGRMKLAHLSTTELVMISAQTGGIHLYEQEKKKASTLTLSAFCVCEILHSRRYVEVAGLKHCP